MLANNTVISTIQLNNGVKSSTENKQLFTEIKLEHNTAFVCPILYCFSCSRYHVYYFIFIFFSSVTMCGLRLVD